MFNKVKMLPAEVAPGMLVKLDNYAGLFMVWSQPGREIIVKEVAWNIADQGKFQSIHIYLNGKTNMYDVRESIKVVENEKTGKNSVMQLEDGIWVPEKRRILRTLEEHLALPERIGPLAICTGAFDYEDLFKVREQHKNLIRKRFMHYQLKNMGVFIVTSVGVYRAASGNGYFTNTPNNNLVVHLQLLGRKEHATLSVDYDVFRAQFTEVKS